MAIYQRARAGACALAIAMMPPIKRLAGKVNLLSERISQQEVVIAQQESAIAQHEAAIKTQSDERAALQRQIEQLSEELSREQAKSDGLVFKIDDRLVLKNPTPQTALDIFKDTWTSKMPGDFAKFEAGRTPLFDDERIPLCASHFGGIDGKNVLDLGPLEGGQAYVLEKLGARSVVSVEANAILYLKCLIAKEILGMTRTRFLCGDVVEYLKSTVECFDICIASGILYHMSDPVDLLRLLSQKADGIMIWTHYFEEGDLTRNKIMSFKGVTKREFNGLAFNYHRQEYGIGFKTNVYCGGAAQHSNWMSRDGVITALKAVGYTHVRVLQDGDSINGPYLLLTATR